MKAALIVASCCAISVLTSAGGQTAPYAAATALPEPSLFQPGVISTADDESHPAFTPDGRTLYFLKNTPTFDFWTIVVSRFDGGRWTTPEVAPFSGRYSDADPFVSRDGRHLFFISTRPVDGRAKTDTDLWVADREASGWGAPRHLDLVNSPASEWFPTTTSDGTLYFGSSREGGRGANDIWRSRFVNGAYAAPENLGAVINTPAGEVEPFIAPDESYLIFAGNGRPDSFGAYDLYVSYRRNGEWSAPLHLPKPINSDGWDFAPKVSPDGKYLFFSSSRGFGNLERPTALTYAQLEAKLHAPGNGLRDIYQIDLSAVLKSQ